MIVWFLLILIWINGIQCSHFNGGTIHWTPVYPSSNSSSVLITITQSYSWNSPPESCTTNIPRSTGSNVNLTCGGNCSTQDGFSNMTIGILTDCILYSASKGLVYSQRSINITLDINTYFWIAYKGSAWRTLQNGGAGGAWSIVSLIDLTRRPDGLINSPPVPQINSPQYVIVNKTSTITISVTDANAGDDIRCRWSQQNGTSGVNECASACTNSNITKLGNLTGCTLRFTGPIAAVWYALTLQVEDFINTTSTSPMSSVPTQFLIYVLPAPSCTQAPVIIPLTGCLEVQANVPVNFTLYTMNYCNKTTSVVNSLLPTVNINYMNISNLINSTTNTSLVYVTLIWTPQISQIGSQEFCAIAYTNENVQSVPYCVAFNVVTSIPCTTTTTVTTTTTSTTSATTSTTTSTEAISTIIAGITTMIEATSPANSFTTGVTSETIIETSETTTETTEATTEISEATSAILEATTAASETTIETSEVTGAILETASISTITITTTTVSGSNGTNIPFIVGMSLLGLFLLLGCSLCCLYYFVRGPGARRCLRDKKKRNSQGEIETIIQSDPSELQNNSDDNESKTEESLRSYSSKIPLLSDSTSENDQKRINSSDKNTPVVQLQSKAECSSTSVPTIPKVSTITETVKAKKPNKPIVSSRYMNITRKPSSLIHSFTLAKNKVAASSITPTNTYSKTNISGKSGSNTPFTTCSIPKQNKISAADTDKHNIIELETLPNDDHVQKPAATIHRIKVNIIEIPDNQSKTAVNDTVSVTSAIPENNRTKSILNGGTTVSTTNTVKTSDKDCSPPIHDKVSTTDIKADNKRSKSFMKRTNKYETPKADKNKANPLMDDLMSPTNIKAGKKGSKSFVSHANKGKPNLLIDDEVSETRFEADNNRSNSIDNTECAATTIKLINKKDNLLVNHGVLQTSITADNNRATSSVNDGITASTIKVHDNEDNPLLNDGMSGTDIGPDSNRSNLLLNTGTATKTTGAAVNEVNPLIDNMLPTKDNRSLSFDNEAFSASSVRAPDSEDKPLVKEEAYQKHIQANDNYSESFVNPFINNMPPANDDRSLSFDNEAFSASSIKVSDSEDKPLFKDEVPERNIQADNYQSKSFVAKEAAENESNSLVDNITPASNIEVDNDLFAASPLKVPDNENTTFFNDGVPQLNIEPDSNRSSLSLNTEITTKTTGAAENEVNSFIDNMLSATSIESDNNGSHLSDSDSFAVTTFQVNDIENSIEGDNNKSESFVNECIAPNTTKAIDNEDNPLIGEEVLVTSIEVYENGNHSYDNNAFAANIVKVLDNEENPLVNDRVSEENIEPDNNRSNSFLNTTIKTNTTSAAENEGNPLIDNIVPANDDRNLSFDNEAFSASSVKVPESEDKPLLKDEVPQRNIQDDNNQSNSLVDNIMPAFNIEVDNDLFAASPLKVPDNEDNALVNGGMSEKNIEAEKSRRDSFVNDEIVVNITKAVDNEENPLIDDELFTSNSEVDDNDVFAVNIAKVPHNPDNSFVSDGASGINIEADNNKNRPFANGGLTTNTANGTQNKGNSIWDFAVVGTNILPVNDRKKPLVNNETPTSSLNMITREFKPRAVHGALATGMQIVGMKVNLSTRTQNKNVVSNKLKRPGKFHRAS